MDLSDGATLYGQLVRDCVDRSLNTNQAIFGHNVANEEECGKSRIELEGMHYSDAPNRFKRI